MDCLSSSPFFRRILAVVLSFAAALPGLAGAFGPGADVFAQATEIGKTGVSEVTSLLRFSRERYEPSHVPNIHSGSSQVLGKTAWWKWTCPKSGFYNVSTRPVRGGVEKTVLGLYIGDSVSALTKVMGTGVSEGNSSRYGALSQMTFFAMGGTTFRIAVDARSSETVRKGLVKLGLVPMKTTTLASTVSIGGGDVLGHLSLTVSAAGRYSGRLLLDGKTLPFAGSYGGEETLSETLIRKAPVGAEPLPPLLLTVDPKNDWVFNLQMEGNILEENRLVEASYFSAADPHPSKRYTAQVDMTATTGYGLNLGIPGVLVFGVNARGTANGVVCMPDNRRITFAAPLNLLHEGSFSHLEFYRSLHNGRGGIQMAVGVNAKVEGRVFYRTPDWKIEANVDGGIYTPPPRRSRGGIIVVVGPGSVYDHMALLWSAAGIAGDLPRGYLRVPCMESWELLSHDVYGVFKFIDPQLRPVLKKNQATGFVTGAIDDWGSYNEGRRERRSFVGCMSWYQPTVYSASKTVLRGYVLPGKEDDGWSPGFFEVAR